MRVLGWASLVVVSVGGCTTTTPTYCTPDETMCHGSCAPLYKDPENCGACDRACGSGFVCSQSACATSCGGGTIECGDGYCIDPLVDRQNCGGCGKTCGAELFCDRGTCSATCAPMQQLCTSTLGPYCATLTSDNQNCGKCGKVCPSELTCLGGICSSQCAPTQTICSIGSAPAFCTDTAVDPANCGACGATCAMGGFCYESHCVCPGAQEACGGTCIDTTSDPQNCGGCGAACLDSSSTCVASHCVDTIYWTGGSAAAAFTFGTKDATDVFVALEGGGILQLAKDGSSDMVLSASNTTSLAVDGAYVYWPSSVGASFVAIGGSAVSTQTLAGTPGELVTDGTNVYATMADDIVAFPSGGGTVTTLLTGASSPAHLRVVGGFLYWTNASNEVQRMGTDGTSLATVVTMDAAIKDLATDGVSVYLVWGNDIVASAADGSTLPMALAVSGSTPYHVTTDGTYVYWDSASAVTSVPCVGGATRTWGSGGATTPMITDGTALYWSTTSAVRKATL